MKTRIREASGQIRFSWDREQAISHFLHPLHLESSRAIQIGSFLPANFHPLREVPCLLALRFKHGVNLKRGV
jgi:hypothetical protein